MTINQAATEASPSNTFCTEQFRRIRLAQPSGGTTLLTIACTGIILPVGTTAIDREFIRRCRASNFS